MLKVNLRGEFFATISEPEQLSAMVALGDAPEADYEIDQADLADFQAMKARDAVREKIGEEAGDMPSLLGTTSDASQLAIFGLASLVAKLAAADSLKEVRDAAKPFAAMSAEFLSKIESGDVQLPFMVKGIPNVIADIEARSTAVTGVLVSAQKGDN